MKRLSEIISEDSNQFGPGTDLVISLMAVLLVMVLITGHLYDTARKQTDSFRELYESERAKLKSIESLLEHEKKKNENIDKGGNFRTASASFLAGDFETKPVTRLVDPIRADETIRTIVQEYEAVQNEFPFIFVIGHSNQLDDPQASEKTYGARLERNWDYAGRRAGVIARLIQDNLASDKKEQIVVVSTGEFDMRDPDSPNSPRNAWVEVVFGKEWKLPSRVLAQ